MDLKPALQCGLVHAKHAKIDAGVAGVADDVAADRVNCVAKELVRFSHNLVGHDCHGVECSG